jgi:hypothetical protein
MFETDLIGIAVLTGIYYAVVFIMLFAVFGSSFMTPFVPPSDSPGLESSLPSENEVSAMPIIIGVVGFLLVAMAYISGLIWLVASRFSDRPRLNFEDAFVLGLRSLPQLMGVITIQVLAIGSLIFVPAIAAPPFIFITLPVAVWIGIKWSFALHAVVLEGHGVYTAFGRSGELVKGSWLRVFGIIMIIGIILGVLTQLLSQIDTSGWITMLLTVVATPIQVVVVTLLYGDLRARFDERRALAEPTLEPPS